MEQLRPSFKQLEKELDNIFSESKVEEEDKTYLKEAVFSCFKKHVGTISVVSPPIAQVPVDQHEDIKTSMMLKLFDTIEQVVKSANQKCYQTVKDHEGTKFGLTLSIYQKERMKDE